MISVSFLGTGEGVLNVASNTHLYLNSHLVQDCSSHIRLVVESDLSVKLKVEILDGLIKAEDFSQTPGDYQHFAFAVIRCNIHKSRVKFKLLQKESASFTTLSYGT